MFIYQLDIIEKIVFRTPLFLFWRGRRLARVLNQIINRGLNCLKNLNNLIQNLLF